MSSSKPTSLYPFPKPPKTLLDPSKELIPPQVLLSPLKFVAVKPSSSLLPPQFSLATATTPAAPLPPPVIIDSQLDAHDSDDDDDDAETVLVMPSLFTAHNDLVDIHLDMDPQEEQTSDDDNNDDNDNDDDDDGNVPASVSVTKDKDTAPTTKAFPTHTEPMTSAWPFAAAVLVGGLVTYATYTVLT